MAVALPSVDMLIFARVELTSQARDVTLDPSTDSREETALGTQWWADLLLSSV